jgi:TPP-dependent pyruvate/acetoin dehydrogenase alpha subunit
VSIQASDVAVATAPSGVRGRDERLRMVRAMMRIRVVEETLADLYREQEMRTPTHFAIGQEAVAVGVCSALRADDVAYSGHRCHAHYLAKGGDLNAMVAELYGRETGSARGRGGSVHLSAPDVGFFGDGVAEEGIFHETLNFAVVKRVPVVFVCENNGYSTHTPLDVRQPRGVAIWQRAQCAGMPARLVDGNDVFAVREAAEEALASVRAGNGPFFIECTTYRWREHVGPNWDYDLGYRTKAEVDAWIERCPVQRGIDTLVRELAWTNDDADKWRAECLSELGAAVAAAKSAPFPSVDSLLDGTY